MGYMHATHQVTGNFSPGQFSFSSEKHAIEWAKEKRKEGYDAEVSKLR